MAKRKSQSRAAKFERCVKSVKKSNPGANPYAVCNASIPASKKRKKK